MNKRMILCLSLLLVITGFSIPVYGKESFMGREGNLKGIQEQIVNLKEDYLFLEREIQILLEECK